MAVRVVAAEVNAILDTHSISDADIGAYIVTANTLVNSVLGTGTDDIYSQIEKYLAAHLVSISRLRQAKKEEAGGAKIEYTGFWMTGLNSTSYGQMVLALDTTGAFAALMKKPASITAITSFE